MKAIIPVAGIGTRLRPHTYTQPKALIPVAGKPILSFIIDELLENDVEEFVFIVGYLGEKIKEFISEKYPDMNAVYVNQQHREGLGHAIWLTENVVESDEILVVLGDTILDGNIGEFLSSEHSTIGLKRVNDPREFGVALVDENDVIIDLVEKPEIPKSNLAIVGVYKIKESRKLYRALEHNIKNDIRVNGEFSLTDGICRMIKEDDALIKALYVEKWFDLGKRDILLETNAEMLEKYATDVNEEFENTIVIPPVSISKGVSIKNSIIGPYVSIGENSEINYCIVKNSIIGNYTHLNDVSLNQSIIGSDAIIKGHNQSLNIGDNTEIDLSN